jgi:hypothetical protein
LYMMSGECRVRMALASVLYQDEAEVRCADTSRG